ncbi:hypothetical protein HELRODRAFT_169251 [Helobdella robusta]|uniref:Uncharacterized protein n=1 Tax=Helobdella robusta TaxID=6412 RepID=T1F1M9_HELRO|nr:hypothetical protein HELRODRAFT_169251 [Helobdella robusta]ESO08413.1 hypothetical protein HELRODRAFT_169251 [Helobdella robusta]
MEEHGRWQLMNVPWKQLLTISMLYNCYYNNVHLEGGCVGGACVREKIIGREMCWKGGMLEGGCVGRGCVGREMCWKRNVMKEKCVGREMCWKGDVLEGGCVR